MPKSSRPAGPQRRLRNEDYTDRELLGIIKDHADGEGYASSEDIARAVGFASTNNGRSPAGRVGTRLAWMRRYGFITRPEEGEARWTLTPIGKELLDGKLNRSVESALDRMGAGDQLLTMRVLSRRRTSPEVSTALRREYLHNLAQGK